MENIKKVSNDPKLFMYELRKNKKDFIFWGVAIFLVLIIFIFICSKEISVLQTLSSMTKTLSFISILLKVLNFQNCSGLSISSLLCFYISLACKILISFFSVRLRDYKVNFSNSTFINISEYSSFFIIVYLIYTSYYKLYLLIFTIFIITISDIIIHFFNKFHIFSIFYFIYYITNKANNNYYNK